MGFLLGETQQCTQHMSLSEVITKLKKISESNQFKDYNASIADMFSVI